MTSWKIENCAKVPKLNKPILVEGLPGIGNVGKVAVDFIIDELKAKKFCEFSSYDFPHSVFVNEENLVELPTIEMYYKKLKNSDHDVVILAGDVQPIDERSCYEFSDMVIDVVSKMDVQEIITLGGVGVHNVPKNPKVYCTANCKDIIKKYKKGNGAKLSNNLYGVVGPIIGVSGLLVGLASRKKMKAISFLAETYGHPMYIGIKGAKEIIEILNNNLTLGINTEKMKKEIEKIEKHLLKETDEGGKVQKLGKLSKLKRGVGGEVSYIG